MLKNLLYINLLDIICGKEILFPGGRHVQPNAQKRKEKKASSSQETTRKQNKEREEAMSLAVQKELRELIARNQDGDSWYLLRLCSELEHLERQEIRANFEWPPPKPLMPPPSTG